MRQVPKAHPEHTLSHWITADHHRAISFYTMGDGYHRTSPKFETKAVRPYYDRLLYQMRRSGSIRPSERSRSTTLHLEEHHMSTWPTVRNHHWQWILVLFEQLMWFLRAMRNPSEHINAATPLRKSTSIRNKQNDHRRHQKAPRSEQRQMSWTEYSGFIGQLLARRGVEPPSL